MEEINYYHILGVFDQERDNGGMCIVPLTEFCSKLVKESREGEEVDLDRFLESKDGKSLPEEVYDAIGDLPTEYLGIGFAVGYVLGQECDIGDQHILRIVNHLKKRIFEAKVLPYFPRIKQKMEEPQSPTAK